MKRTPLYQIHTTLNAKFTEFGGWEMPLQYSSIVKEHLAVRTTVGLFDLSHMGELEVYGQGANALVQNLSTNDVGRLTDGRVFYTLFCNEAGGIVDDLLVYRYTDNHYMLVVNAANIEKDRMWVENHNNHWGRNQRRERRHSPHCSTGSKIDRHPKTVGSRTSDF